MARSKSQSALTHENIYNAFAEAVEDLVYVVDRDGRYVMFNEKGLSSCGFDKEQVIGRTPVEAFGPEIGAAFMRNNEKVLKSGKPMSMQEWIAIRGVSRCYSTALDPVFDESGKAQAVIGISRDISELKRMVEELQIGSERMKSLFRQRVHYEHLVKGIVRDSITRHDIEDFLHAVVVTLGEGLSVGRSYFFRYDLSRQAAQNTHEWVAPGVEPNKEMMQDVKTQSQPWLSSEMLAGRVICLEDVGKAPSPELVELMRATDVRSILAIPIFVFGRPYGFIGFDQCDENRHWDDIDVELLNSVCRIVAQKIERHRLEEEMLGSERMAAMGRLTSVFTHEINNPLQGILLHLEGMDEHVDEGGRKAFGYVMDGFKRIAEIISRLSDASRSKVEKREVAVNDLVKSAYGLLSKKVDMKGISVRWFLEEGLPKVMGDERKLHQAVLNVLINACDSMGKGGSLSIASSKAGGRVCIEVGDTGCGIDEQAMPYLFEPFFTTKGKSGTGLGLFVSHSIMSEHGGEIEIQSARGEGSTARLWLPGKK